MIVCLGQKGLRLFFFNGFEVGKKGLGLPKTGVATTDDLLSQPGCDIGYWVYIPCATNQVVGFCD